MNYPDGKDGPVLSDEGGQLATPVWKCHCAYQNHRCKHLGWHDRHYPYCSGQPSPNNDGSKSYNYPWPGAGTHIFHNRPNKDCPFAVGVLAIEAERSGK